MNAKDLNLKLERLAPTDSLESDIINCLGKTIVEGTCAERIKKYLPTDAQPNGKIKSSNLGISLTFNTWVIYLDDDDDDDGDEDFNEKLNRVCYYKNQQNLYQAKFYINNLVKDLDDILKVWFNFCRKLGFQIHRVVKRENTYLVYFSILDNRLNLYQYTYIRAAFVKGYFTTVKLFYKIKKNMPELDDLKAFYVAQSINSFFKSYNPYYGFSNNDWKKTDKDGLYLLHAESVEITTNSKFQFGTSKCLKLNTFEIKDKTTGQVIYSNSTPTNNIITNHTLPRCIISNHPIVMNKDFIPISNLEEISRPTGDLFNVITEENNFQFSNTVSNFVNRVLLLDIWTEAETEFILNQI